LEVIVDSILLNGAIIRTYDDPSVLFSGSTMLDHESYKRHIISADGYDIAGVSAIDNTGITMNSMEDQGFGNAEMLQKDSDTYNNQMPILSVIIINCCLNR